MSKKFQLTKIITSSQAKNLTNRLQKLPGSPKCFMALQAKNQTNPPRQAKNGLILLAAVLLTPLLFFTPFLNGNPQAKKITYEQAYLNGKPRLLKNIPSLRGWLDEKHYLLFERGQKNQPAILYKIEAPTGQKEILIDYGKIQKSLPSELKATAHVTQSKDYQTLIYYFNNDLYLYQYNAHQFRRLTATPAPEQNPKLSPDEKFLAYTRQGNLYCLDLESGLEYQLTTDGSSTISNGWASWVYYEEILGRSSRYAAFWWSPDSQHLAFLRFDESPVPTFPLFRSGGPHGELEIERYPKAGDPNPYVRLGVVSRRGGSITWANIPEKADHYIAWPFWLPNGQGLTFQWMNRQQDHLIIYLMNLANGQIKKIYEEKQPSWVEFLEDLYFCQDQPLFLVRSDQDGWAHLYLYNLEGKLVRRLTQGEWTVTQIALVDELHKNLYFVARQEPTTESHLLVINFDGRGLKRLTQKPGTHRVLVAPQGKYFLDYFSNLTTPTQVNLHRGDGRLVKKLGDATTPLLAEYNLPQKQLLTITTSDGWKLPAYWILPPNFDQSKKYPVLFMIYSGPGSSTVSNSYPSLSSLYLAQEGIIIFSVDHRGSGHFGKKGMSLMHRRLGHWEMHDLIEAVKWLRQKPFVDPTKIGITGGSYGGYTTCLALTYGADFFTHGYARSSVTDWRLYDTVYTERYMDRPQENPEGYQQSSVLTHAAKLKGILFMAHGDMDDNVHMQNTIQLISRLMDLGKKFEFMVYPDQRHGFRAKKREHSNRHFVDFWFKQFLNR